MRLLTAIIGHKSPQNNQGTSKKVPIQRISQKIIKTNLFKLGLSLTQLKSTMNRKSNKSSTLKAIIHSLF